MALYVITYQVGTQSGQKRTEAQADDVALANVQAWVSATIQPAGPVACRISVRVA